MLRDLKSIFVDILYDIGGVALEILYIFVDIGDMFADLFRSLF